MKNWKEIILEIFDNQDLLGFMGEGLKDIDFQDEVVEAVLEFAEIYAEFKCKEQKELNKENNCDCNERERCYGVYFSCTKCGKIHNSFK